jgi:hypothetical protein
MAMECRSGKVVRHDDSDEENSSRILCVSGEYQSIVDVVPIDRLLPGDSPRLDGESLEHARLLANSGARLPPILVHRPTARVIDGMHRLHAARLRGQDEIEVRFFDGDEHAAFALAVEANTSHGLALPLADRKAAATRILSFYPAWSDRRIAHITGLSSSTVAGIRKSDPSGAAGGSNARIGRDGNLRSLNTVAGRRLALSLMGERPTASVREIAADAGIARSTVQDVRKRLRAGRDPIPSRQRDDGGTKHAKGAEQRSGHPLGTDADCSSESKYFLDMLKSDPSLRLTGMGRGLLRLLSEQTVIENNLALLVTIVPGRSLDPVAELVRTIADGWHSFADRLERRERRLSSVARRKFVS